MILLADSKSPGQTVWMHRPTWAFTVRIHQRLVFAWCSLNRLIWHTKFGMVLFYFSDTKPHNTAHDEKITLKKVLDLVNKSDEQGLREMNKKLQNMLEETLTKNMHLQKVRFCIL